MSTADISPEPRARSRGRLILLSASLVAATLLLIALGVWQLQRRVWKLELISEIEQRIHAPVVDAPGPEAWPGITAGNAAYRHIRAAGRWLSARDTLAQAVTVRGAGFWVLTPLQTDTGFTVLVNRGFVAADDARSATQITGSEETVTGLLRLSEPKGGFLHSNDAASNRWYSRDVTAIAQARGLANVAPYFIDADAGPGKDGLIGGLTVVRLPNNHLVYALTWFALAAMALGGLVVLLRDEASFARPIPRQNLV